MSLRDLLNRVKANPFLKNVAILSSGTIISQLIVIGISPLLSRLYSVESFGILSIFTSIAVFFAVLSTGRYELALGLPEENHKAVKIFKLIIFISIFVSILYLLIIFILKNIIHIHDKNGFFNNNQIYLIPVYIFFAAVNSALGYWNQRSKNYKKITLGNAIQVIITSIFSLVFGFLHKEIGLIWALIIGIAVSDIYLFFTDKNLQKQLLASSSGIVQVGKEYISFPKYLILSDLSLTGSQQFIPILFSMLYNTTVVGFFAMANRILRIPNLVITGSIGNVFRNDAIDEIRKNGNCEHLYQSTIKKLAMMSLPIYLVIFIISPAVFMFVFGKEWEIAGYFARIMAAMLLFEFIATPLNTLFYVRGKQKILMRLQVLNAIVIFTAIYVGYYFFKDYYYSLMLYSLVSIISNIVFIIFTNKLSKGAI